MISRERLAGCSGREDIASLFRALGYPARLRMLDRDEWLKGGIELPEQSSATTWHVCRSGTVDLLLLESSTPLDQAIVLRTLTGYASRNHLIKCVLILFSSGTRTLRLSDLAPNRRLRHVDISLDDPRAEALYRFNLLDTTHAGEPCDPRSLFDRALDRETVTRRFFSRFRNGVATLIETLRPQVADEPDEALRSHSLLILCRLLFLYFVQEKGWLDNNPRFIREAIDAAETRGEEFFSTTLGQLFFGCLNTHPASRAPSERALGEIPYLNGGLFEPTPFEERNSQLLIPNHAMRLIIEEIYERFAFSVEERDGEAAHVDPEMLGKVFESLMADEERARSGSFYTPKTVASSLAARAIVEWLSAGSERERRELRRLLSGEEFELSRSEALHFLRALEGVTILDPACGTGALLLAALQTIELLWRGLALRAEIEVPVDIRRVVVERSLFGVDLKPEAVRLCELRLWLAIVARSSFDIQQVPPLPNLDRNIFQGNSLIGPLDYPAVARLDIFRDWRQSLRKREELIAEYRHARPNRKAIVVRKLRESDRDLAVALLERSLKLEELELARMREGRHGLFGPVTSSENELRSERSQSAKITAIVEELQRVRQGEIGFFAFELHFAAQIAAGGFDVIVTNPPWVRSSRLEAGMRKSLSDRYSWFRAARNGRKGGFEQQADVSIAFAQRCLDLLAPGGSVSLLLPAKVLNAHYAVRFRREVAAGFRIASLDDWSTERAPLFEADTFPLGLTISKTRNQKPETRRKKNPELAAPIEIHAAGESFSSDQREIAVDSDGAEWTLLPSAVAALFRQLQSGPPLAQMLGRAPIMGVKTGANQTFFLADVQIEGATAMLDQGRIALPSEHLCRCVRGRDVRRWQARSSTWMLWPPLNGWDSRPPWAAKLSEFLGLPLDILRLAYVRPEHLGVKVAWKDLSRGMQAAVLPDVVSLHGTDFHVVPNQTLYSLDTTSMEEAWALSALLNSSIVNALAVSRAERAKDFHFRFFGRLIGSIPAPQSPLKGTDWLELARLGRRAERGERVQNDVDDLAAHMYGLDLGQQQAIEGYLARELGHG